MTWQDFYLICFLVGLALSVVSFLLGSFDFHLHFHLDGHGDFIDFHGPDAGHAPAGGHGDAGGHSGTQQPHLSWLNFGTVTAFLAWFGGAGYLLTRFSGWVAWLSLGVALIAGLVGGAIMFWFVAKVLMKYDQPLNPVDYDMIGVLATVTVPIREGGTGEIVFAQQGSRRCSGARADQGEAIPKGTEVIVTRYEKGIAYVRQWEEMANGTGVGSGTEK